MYVWYIIKHTQITPLFVKTFCFRNLKAFFLHILDCPNVHSKVVRNRRGGATPTLGAYAYPRRLRLRLCPSVFSIDVNPVYCVCIYCLECSWQDGNRIIFFCDIANKCHIISARGSETRVKSPTSPKCIDTSLPCGVLCSQ